jgi:hypothetical protein
VGANLQHCAAIRSRKSCAVFSSGPFRGLIKTMRSLGCDRLALRRWIPRGMVSECGREKERNGIRKNRRCSIFLKSTGLLARCSSSGRDIKRARKQMRKEADDATRRTQEVALRGDAWSRDTLYRRQRLGARVGWDKGGKKKKSGQGEGTERVRRVDGRDGKELPRSEKKSMKREKNTQSSPAQPRRESVTCAV